MKKSLLFSLFILLGLSAGAQKIIKQSIDNGGGISVAGNLVVISTLGEVVVAEKNTSTVHISEGFINQNIFLTVGVKNYTKLEGISIFPNPTADYLLVELPTTGSYSIQLFDLLGYELANDRFQGQSSFKLDIRNLQPSTYLVLVKNQSSKQFRSFKIVKN